MAELITTSLITSLSKQLGKLFLCFNKNSDSPDEFFDDLRDTIYAAHESTVSGPTMSIPISKLVKQTGCVNKHIRTLTLINREKNNIAKLLVDAINTLSELSTQHSEDYIISLYDYEHKPALQKALNSLDDCLDRLYILDEKHKPRIRKEKPKNFKAKIDDMSMALYPNTFSERK